MFTYVHVFEIIPNLPQFLWPFALSILAQDTARLFCSSMLNSSSGLRSWCDTGMIFTLMSFDLFTATAHCFLYLLNVSNDQLSSSTSSPAKHQIEQTPASTVNKVSPTATFAFFNCSAISRKRQHCAAMLAASL